MSRKTLFELWMDFVYLFYPNLCLACFKNLQSTKDELCLECSYLLPKTKQHFDKNNIFTERFEAHNIQLYTGSAYYYFRAGNRTQSLIHQIKYHGRKEAAVKIGQSYGRKLLESPLYHDVALIIPVPMHPHKERLRGYNQANLFAEGLSNALNIPCVRDALKKIKTTESQTRKNHIERLDNVKNVFQLENASSLENKHILLVDDVLTTGATLQACAKVLAQVPNIKISMATIAIAHNDYM